MSSVEADPQISSVYDFELSRLLKFFRKNKSILIQLPDGLKKYFQTFLNICKDCKLYLSSSQSWGPCDIALREAYDLGVDLLIHVGHYGEIRFKKLRNLTIICSPAHYLSHITEEDLEKIYDKLVKFDIKSVNICASAQHLKEIPVFTKFLEKKGLKVTVGQAPFLSPGQVIGCDYRALVPSDAYIVIAGGLFHGIGVKLLRPSKPVVVFDPYTRTLRDIEKISKKLLTLHLFNLTKALEAKNFGILVSLKSGQNRLTLAHHIKKLLEKHELKAEIITFYNITKEKLENIYWYDTFINTACPRITVENQTLIRTPIINANEVKYILEKSLASFRTEHLIQLPPKHICTKQLLEI